MRNSEIVSPDCASGKRLTIALLCAPPNCGRREIGGHKPRQYRIILVRSRDRQRLLLPELRRLALDRNNLAGLRIHQHFGDVLALEFERQDQRIVLVLDFFA